MFLPPLSKAKSSFSPSLPSGHVRAYSQDRTLSGSSKLTSSPVQRFWKVSGRHARISSQIDPRYYYQDTSLSSFDKRQGRLERQLKHYQQLKVRYETILSDRKRKAEVVKEVKTKYAVKFTKREVAASSSTQLALAALTLVHEREKQKAASTIAKAWRGWLWRRAATLLEVKKKAAARRVQQAWKRHVVHMKEKAEKEVRMKAAVQIQRAWKGYSVRRCTKEQITEMRMRKHFLYFDTIRAQLLADSARVVWRRWKLYKVGPT